MTDDDLITEIERAERLVSDFVARHGFRRFGDYVIEGKRGLHRRRHAVHYTAAVSSIKSLMSGYFKAQGAAVLVVVRPHIVSVINQFRESATGKRFADSLVPVSLQPLRFPTSGAEDLAFTAAITQLIQGASVTLAQEVSAGEIDAPNIASQYLRDNSLSKLTGKLSTTTTSRLQDAIADAWDAGGSYDQIVGAIKDTFEDFSEKRAGLIARTEAADAYNEGRAATAQRMGLKQKSWETESGDPCPICIGNEEQGWIGSSELFDSEDAAPTAHVNCECVLNFR